MGFRTGRYCKVWEITPKSDSLTTLRISTSRKNKQTGEFETDFSGFVSCVGTSAAKKALFLNEGDSVKIGDVDVTTKYDKEKGITYTNFIMYSFETNNEVETNQDVTDPQPQVDDGEAEENRLPF